jgi:redox-sensitive bicupin YhaK (pirin superfamily)
LKKENSMIEIRKREERGTTRRIWLERHHSFSFGEYQDPKHVRFGPLRVLNDDVVAPDGGFPTHPHQNAEVITYVLSGEVEHRDSEGNRGVIRPFDIQRMRAGRGITHSEYNPSDREALHLLQIWILPDKLSLAPGYAQKTFDPEARRGTFLPVITPNGEGETLDIAQDATMLVAHLEPGESASHRIEPGRGAYLHVATGSATANGAALRAGDGAKLQAEKILTVTASEPTELVLFDLPL